MHIHAFLTCASCRCRRPGKLVSLLKITAPRAVCVCSHTYALKKQLTLIILPTPLTKTSTLSMTYPPLLFFFFSQSPPAHLTRPHPSSKKKTISPYQPSISPSNSPLSHPPHSLLLPQHCRMYSTAMSLVSLSLLLFSYWWCWCWYADHAHHC